MVNAVHERALAARSTARWGVGGAIASWRYLMRTTRVIREETTERGPDLGPADRPVGGDQESVQRRADGAGPSLRRLYRTVIAAPTLTPEELMDAIARDPNRASPFEIARFVKISGRLGELVEGDEYLVWLAGPWNGPVRVAERTPTSFRLATLEGHMEAGEIEFRARDDGGSLVFEIESVARSGSSTFWLVYGPLRAAKEVQLHMWAEFCENAARISGGRPTAPVRVETRNFPDDRGEPVGNPSRRARRALDGLQDRQLNFDPDELSDAGPASGWTVDDHRVELPAEAPGPPRPDGPWEIARDHTRHYRFAPPDLIEGVFVPDERMEGRNMLLQGKFLGLRFLFGVRVNAVVDEEAGLVEGRPARIWGWSYRTLEGHLESGQMDFQVVKFLETGAVEFRIHAVSRRAPIRNPVVRIGFRFLGRRLQLRFARLAGARMQRLVRTSLERRDHSATGPQELAGASDGRPPDS